MNLKTKHFSENILAKISDEMLKEDQKTRNFEGKDQIEYTLSVGRMAGLIMARKIILEESNGTN